LQGTDRLCYRTAERKRRQVYRGEIHGQLPFDAKGMDDSVPTIDFSPVGPTDTPYTLERSDVDGKAVIYIICTASSAYRLPELLKLFDELEHFTQKSDPVAYESVRQTRQALEKAVAKIDAIEESFDRIAERTCECPHLATYCKLIVQCQYCRRLA
jgi:autophagy-related protein 11